MPGNELFN